MAKLTGGCLCGAVRYECSAEPMMAMNCYCRDCQRAGGSAMASAFLVPRDAFKLTKGSLKYYESTADSGTKVRRAFCANCGSPIVSENAEAAFVAVKAGSLDDPGGFKPAANIYVSSAPPWAPVLAHLPTFDKMPG
jgi:hypothetical protein